MLLGFEVQETLYVLRGSNAQSFVQLKYLEDLKEEKRFGLCFWKLHDRKKVTDKTFSTYKLTSKLRLVYLEVKLHTGRWCIYKLKWEAK